MAIDIVDRYGWHSPSWPVLGPERPTRMHAYLKGNLSVPLEGSCWVKHYVCCHRGADMCFFAGCRFQTKFEGVVLNKAYGT